MLPPQKAKSPSQWTGLGFAATLIATISDFRDWAAEMTNFLTAIVEKLNISQFAMQCQKQ
jgi:hypothetical protein